MSWGSIAFFGGCIVALFLVGMILKLLASRAGLPEPMLGWILSLVTAGGTALLVWLMLRER